MNNSFILKQTIWVEKLLLWKKKTKLVNLKWKVVKVLATQSCLTLCDPMDCSPPGFSVHKVLQARILEFASISFARASFQPRYQTWISCFAGGFFTIWATREATRTLEWVAYTFSRGFSWLRNQIRVSCIAGGLFTSWAMRESCLGFHQFKLFRSWNSSP